MRHLMLPPGLANWSVFVDSLKLCLAKHRHSKTSLLSVGSIDNQLSDCIPAQSFGCCNGVQVEARTQFPCLVNLLQFMSKFPTPVSCKLPSYLPREVGMGDVNGHDWESSDCVERQSESASLPPRDPNAWDTEDGACSCCCALTVQPTMPTELSAHGDWPTRMQLPAPMHSLTFAGYCRIKVPGRPAQARLTLSAS